MRTHHGPGATPAKRPDQPVPAARPAAPLVSLQRAVGNQAVEAMLTVQREGHQHGAGCGHGEEFADPAGAQRAVSDVLGSGGQALTGSRLSEAQDTFKADMSGVREFRGPLAQRATSLLNADAFTIGQNIVYGRETPEIRGHEMTHAMTPMTETTTDIGGGLGVTSPDQEGERFAAENGRRIAAGGASMVTGPLPG